MNRIKQIGQTLQYRARIIRAQADPQHPRLHFAAPAHWMNDPNGLIYWRGKYHAFYQFNPFGAVWGNMHWGHAISEDLLHWQHLPIALAPDLDWVDAGGCFSGCAVDNDGTPTLLYTGVFPETQCLATSSAEDLTSWHKHPDPVIAAPPPGLQVEGFRDPCVWKEDQEWRMVIGSGIHGVGGAILLYRSADLITWDYLGILFAGDVEEREPFWTGTMWECPSFFPLGDKWALIISACTSKGSLYTFYFTGDYRDNQFIPDGPPRPLDDGSGGCYYAPQTFLDEVGQRVIIGWLRESRGNDEMKRAGWSGAFAFPRILTLGEDGAMRFTPLKALNSLRKDHELLTQPEQTSKIRGNLEILLTVRPEQSFWSGAVLAAENNPLERVEIGYSRAKSGVVVDCHLAGGLVSEVPLPLAEGDTLSLRTFVDGSVLEVFIEDRRVISARFYMKAPQNARVRRVGDAEIEVWELG